MSGNSLGTLKMRAQLEGQRFMADLKRVESQIKSLAAPMKKVQNAAKRMGFEFDKSTASAEDFAKGLGLVVGATAAGGFALAEMAAKTEDAKRIFEASGGSLEDLRSATQGLISDADLVKKANLAKQMGIDTGAFKKFAQASIAASKKTGESVSFMFDSIITGVARSSPMILDNLGIVVKLSDAQKTYAKSIGRSVEELSSAQRAMAFQNAAMKASEGLIQEVAAAGATAADKFTKARVKAKNLADAVGSVLAVAVGNATEALIGSTDQLDEWVMAVARGEESMFSMAGISGLIAKKIGIKPDKNLKSQTELPAQLIVPDIELKDAEKILQEVNQQIEAANREAEKIPDVYGDGAQALQKQFEIHEKIEALLHHREIAQQDLNAAQEKFNQAKRDWVGHELNGAAAAKKAAEDLRKAQAAEEARAAAREKAEESAKKEAKDRQKDWETYRKQVNAAAEAERLETLRKEAVEAMLKRRKEAHAIELAQIDEKERRYLAYLARIVAEEDKAAQFAAEREALSGAIGNAPISALQSMAGGASAIQAVAGGVTPVVESAAGTALGAAAGMVVPFIGPLIQTIAEETEKSLNFMASGIESLTEGILGPKFSQLRARLNEVDENMKLWGDAVKGPVKAMSALGMFIEQTRSAQQWGEIMDKIFMTIAQQFEPAIRAFLPALELVSIFATKAGALVDVFGGLNSAGEWLFDAFKNLAIHTLHLVQHFQKITGKTDEIGDTQKAIDAITATMWDEVQARLRNVEATDRATDALNRLSSVNLPGYKGIPGLAFDSGTPLGPGFRHQTGNRVGEFGSREAVLRSSQRLGRGI